MAEIEKSLKQQLWDEEVKMLTVLLNLCDRNNLSIWASGGTLLGAIRHKGFIPWDDDIDLCMFRKDYDTLLKIAPKQLKAPYILQSFYTEKNYPITHAQLRNKETTAILDSKTKHKYCQGVFIDIFVMDVIPPNDTQLEILKRKADSLEYRIINAAESHFSFGLFVHPIKAKRYIKSIFDQLHFKRLCANYENLFRNESITNNSEVAYLTKFRDRDGIERRRRKVDLYRETLLMPFENILIPVPIGYDSILKTQYGAYMTPVKTSSCHGGIEIIDLNKPSSYYNSIRSR